MSASGLKHFNDVFRIKWYLYCSVKKKDAKYIRTILLCKQEEQMRVYIHIYSTLFGIFFEDRNTKTIKHKISCKWLSIGDGNVTSVTFLKKQSFAFQKIKP